MTIRTFENIAPTIHPTAWIDDTALVIGRVTIGADASLQVAGARASEVF